jgi:broad specificity phosphatase PhoE
MPSPSSSPAATGSLHLLFIRHGETQDNIDRVLQGHRDTSLTPKGHAEAAILASKFHNLPISALYHSPLTRMLQTIAPILDAQPNIPTHASTDLRSQALGSLEGGSYDSIDMSNPRSADGQPGVELFDDFVRRLKRILSRIIGTEAPLVSTSSSKNRTVVIATHGVNITSLFKALEATPECEGFNAPLATRGPEAWEVRWTDSDDVAELVVAEPSSLPIREGVLDWEGIQGMPFMIARWGKREKAI